MVYGDVTAPEKKAAPHGGNESVHVHFDKILPRVIFNFLGNILTIWVIFLALVSC